MNSQAALWLNRLGLLLDLLAFFFVAPELLGGRRLAVDSVYRRGLRLLPPVALGAALTALAAFLAAAAGRIPGELWRKIWALSIVVVTAVLLILAAIVALRALGRAAEVIITRLEAGGTEVSQQFLILGAFLFVLGMALQFIATL